MLLTQNIRNLSLIRGNFYGKGGLTGFSGCNKNNGLGCGNCNNCSRSTNGNNGIGDTVALQFPFTTSDISNSTNPVNWNPNLSTYVTDVNSILLPAEGTAFNASLAPYTTPLGITGGGLITWVQNNVGLLALIGGSLFLLNVYARK